MRQKDSLKPQDIVLIAKLMLLPEEDWRQIDVANALLLPQGEVAKALVRLKKSGLLTNKRVNVSGALEFLSHGLKYVFPAELGAVAVGIPAAMSAPFFDPDLLQGEGDLYVWPSSLGKTRGQIIIPFYPKMPEAVFKDKSLYELMASIEVLRIGRARERKIAFEKIKKVVHVK